MHCFTIAAVPDIRDGVGLAWKSQVSNYLLVSSVCAVPDSRDEVYIIISDAPDSIRVRATAQDASRSNMVCVFVCLFIYFVCSYLV